MSFSLQIWYEMPAGWQLRRGHMVTVLWHITKAVSPPSSRQGCTRELDAARRWGPGDIPHLQPLPRDSKSWQQPLSSPHQTPPRPEIPQHSPLAFWQGRTHCILPGSLSPQLKSQITTKLLQPRPGPFVTRSHQTDRHGEPAVGETTLCVGSKVLNLPLEGETGPDRLLLSSAHISASRRYARCLPPRDNQCEITER